MTLQMLVPLHVYPNGNSVNLVAHAAAAARHLGADVQALFAQVQKDGRPVAEALQDHARAVGADVLVMGAFGQSRVRDVVLGSATGGVLRDLPLPVLLSH